MNNKASENLRKLRKMFGLTGEEMGNYLGVVKSAISGYEKGKTISIENLQRISELFQIPTDILLNSTLPELTIDSIDIEFIRRSIGFLLPAFEPKIGKEEEDDSFNAAFKEHRKLIELMRDDWGKEETLAKWAELDLDLCRENYLRAIRKPQYNIYCKANLIGLFFLKGIILKKVRYYNEIWKPMLMAVSKKTAIISSEETEIKKAINETYNGMRKKEYMQRLDKYLKDLSESKRFFKEEAEYFKCWRYILNLVDNEAGEIANGYIGTQRLCECAKEGNLFAKNFFVILELAMMEE